MGVSSRTTCGARAPGYSTHGPGAFQVALKTRPAAICSAMGVTNAAMAVITSAKLCGTSRKIKMVVGNIILSKGEIKFSIHPPSRNASGYWSVASICGGGIWRL